MSVDGVRECKDIITAALDQGWTFNPYSMSKNGHAYLVPPSGVPVGISSTPSDRNFRHQIIRLMRRSGFVWPPERRLKPTNQAKRTTMAAQAQHEEWRTVHGMSRYQLSNTGRCLEGKTEISPGPGGLLALFDDEGRLREQYVRTMVRQHFGYGPIKVNPLIDEFFNQEEEVTTVEKEVDVTTQTKTDEEWRAVDDPAWEKGWSLSSLGRLKRPNDTIVTATPGATAKKHLIVAYRKAGATGTTTTRLDKLVLTVFGAPGPAGAHPVYLDDDVNNCSFENLDWSDSKLAPVPEEKTTGELIVESVLAQIEEATTEPEVEPEPEIEVPVEPKVEPEPVDPGPGPLSEEEPPSEELDSGQQDATQREHERKATIKAQLRAKAAKLRAEAEKARMDQAVKKVVDQAPSYSHPGLTVGQVEEVGNITLVNQGLSPRPLGSLHQAEITTLADVAKLSEQDLAKLPLMGPDTVDRLKTLLAEHGLSLVEGPEVNWDKRKRYLASERKRKSTERAKRRSIRQGKLAQRVQAIAAEPEAPSGGVAQELSAYKGFTHIPTGTETLVWEDGSFRLTINGDHVVDVEAEDAEVVLAVLTKVAEYRMVMGIG